MAQQINFTKNIAIIGGMLMVMAFGPGRYSVDKD
jgi:putative oxidoreductase